ncbi:hypothetical protein BHE74_00016120 [Ensete ventricosum]|nr:hypothetical protein BHE74_00016120 [Ensete ventricosum]
MEKNWFRYQVSPECRLDLHRSPTLEAAAGDGAPPLARKPDNRDGSLCGSHRRIRSRSSGRGHRNGVLALLLLTLRVEGPKPRRLHRGGRRGVLTQQHVTGVPRRLREAPPFLLPPVLTATEAGGVLDLLVLLLSAPESPQPPRRSTHLAATGIFQIPAASAGFEQEKPTDCWSYKANKNSKGCEFNGLTSYELKTRRAGNLIEVVKTQMGEAIRDKNLERRKGRSAKLGQRGCKDGIFFKRKEKTCQALVKKSIRRQKDVAERRRHIEAFPRPTSRNH